MKTANEIRLEARRILSEFTQTYPILGSMPIRVSSRMTRMGGSVRFRMGRPYEIVLSLPFHANPDSNLRNTVTHEAAHVVAGFNADHGPEWQRVHRSMGGNAKRCHTMTLAEGYERAPREAFPCPKCGQGVMLGPIQAKRARYRGAIYSHNKCPR